MTDSVRVLQGNLYHAAKKNPGMRFDGLYELVYRPDVLRASWREARRNKGRPGVDGQTIEDIVRSGETAFIGKIEEDLRADAYHPEIITRSWVPKRDGGQRPIGISIIRDRTVQGAANLILGPIFEADFEDCSYGYRPGRNTRGAVKEAEKLIIEGYRHVINADLKRCFDSIPHERLMELVTKRIADGRILQLIEGWLKVGILSEDGQIQIPTEGTQQGVGISPLLANIYLDCLDKAWLREGGEEAKLIRYADNVVILCRERPERWLQKLEEDLKRIKLSLNKEKTTVVEAKKGFNFLGFRICWVNGNPGEVLISPSLETLETAVEKIKEATRRKRPSQIGEVIEQVNAQLRGWANYYAGTNNRQPAQKLQKLAERRIRRILNNSTDRSDISPYELGLVDISGRRR